LQHDHILKLEFLKKNDNLFGLIIVLKYKYRASSIPVMSLRIRESGRDLSDQQYSVAASEAHRAIRLNQSTRFSLSTEISSVSNSILLAEKI